MNWFLISIFRNQKEDREIVGSDLNLNEIIEKINNQKFIKFEKRVFWDNQNKKYYDSDLWDSNFTNEFILRTDLILNIIPFKEDPRSRNVGGLRFERNDLKIEVLLGEKFIPIFKENQWKLSIDQLRQEIKENKNIEIPLINFKDWTGLKATEYVIRIQNINIIKKEAKEKNLFEGLFLDLNVSSRLNPATKKRIKCRHFEK